MLTRHLRQLEEDRIISRTVYAEVPPRVEYSLTEMGEKFRSVLDAVEAWGLEYIETLT
ncbi:winged helix-turn-helix transcriptional regulator, partial [Streptococcus suis]